MQPVVLITGATDGIGLALARLYVAAAARVILIGRRAVADLPSDLFTPATYCRADLSHPQCEQTVCRWLDRQQVDTLSLVIHNAAVGYYGSPVRQPPDSVEEILKVNLYAPIALTHALWPRVERGRGKFVFISSVVSALPAPDYAVYAAAKAALDGFARSLAVEAAGRVSVQLIHPGATRTGMHRKSGIPLSQLDRRRFPTAVQTARKIRDAIDGDRPRVTLGPANRLLQMLGIWGGSRLDRLAGRRWRAP